jgi:hypothetical protein
MDFGRYQSVGFTKPDNIVGEFPLEAITKLSRAVQHSVLATPRYPRNQFGRGRSQCLNSIAVIDTYPD